MNSWSNIEVHSADPEIIEIDKFEKTLGDLPLNIKKIRELITRFEVCHFKYQRHIRNIKISINELTVIKEPDNIGAYHLSNDKNAIKNDTTGRSLIGQTYIDSLLNWLGENPQTSTSDYTNKQPLKNTVIWLGSRNPDKERMVRLLIARITGDWESYEKLQHGGQYKDLEFQICRMDICHYAFPQHIDILLQGIGKMRPIDNFEGCGTFNTEIKEYVKDQFQTLCDHLRSNLKKKKQINDEQVKIWLIACFAKTLKEQIKLTQSIPKLLRR
jgi:hypothetical protein